MMFGIFDTVDRCWLGTNDAGTGPKTFPEQALARVAAQVLATQMRWPETRCVARPYDGTGTKYKDALDLPMTTAQALKQIMGDES
jgi:hypothetical protein